MKDDLGKRMKEQYEKRSRTFLPRRTYTIIRIDGKAFHTYTRGMKKPFDQNLADTMDDTAKFLCENVQGTQFAYVQSDEISLLLTDFATISTNAWFDGQVQKMASVSASLATGIFNALMFQRYFAGEEGGVREHYTPETDIHDVMIPVGDIINYMPYGFPKKTLAFFDSRIFTIPDPIEVENYFIWRQKDAVRNSISMVAQSLYSHKELHGKSQSDMQEMIFQKGQNWNDVDPGFKRGRTIMKHVHGHWVSAPVDFSEVGLRGRIISKFIPKIGDEE